VVFYRNPQQRNNWRFHGTATVHESGAIRDAVMERTIQQEMDRDPDRDGVAILVKIDLIDELSGNVLQRRD
jgi:hypothetical protein